MQSSEKVGNTLAGKVSIVTGGARGIGRTSATALVKKGGDVIAADLSESSIAVVAAIRS